MSVVKGHRALMRKYTICQLIEVFDLFVIIPAMVYLLGRIFSKLYDFILTKDPGIIYRVAPDKKIWWLPGITLSLIFCLFITDFALKLILRDRYEDYSIYRAIKSNRHHTPGVNPHTFIRGMLIVTILLILAISKYSVKIYKDKIVLNSVLMISEKTYNLHQIQSIDLVESVQAKNKLRIYRPHFFLKFKDGEYWNTNLSLSENTLPPAIIRALASRAHLRINTLYSDPD